MRELLSQQVFQYCNHTYSTLAQHYICIYTRNHRKWIWPQYNYTSLIQQVMSQPLR